MNAAVLRYVLSLVALFFGIVRGQPDCSYLNATLAPSGWVAAICDGRFAGGIPTGSPQCCFIAPPPYNVFTGFFALAYRPQTSVAAASTLHDGSSCLLPSGQTCAQAAGLNAARCCMVQSARTRVLCSDHIGRMAACVGATAALPAPTVHPTVASALGQTGCVKTVRLGAPFNPCPSAPGNVCSTVESVTGNCCNTNFGVAPVPFAAGVDLSAAIQSACCDPNTPCWPCEPNQYQFPLAYAPASFAVYNATTGGTTYVPGSAYICATQRSGCATHSDCASFPGNASCTATLWTYPPGMRLAVGLKPALESTQPAADAAICGQSCLAQNMNGTGCQMYQWDPAHGCTWFNYTGQSIQTGTQKGLLYKAPLLGFDPNSLGVQSGIVLDGVVNGHCVCDFQQSTCGVQAASAVCTPGDAVQTLTAQQGLAYRIPGANAVASAFPNGADIVPAPAQQGCGTNCVPRFMSECAIVINDGHNAAFVSNATTGVSTVWPQNYWHSYAGHDPWNTYGFSYYQLGNAQLGTCDDCCGELIAKQDAFCVNPDLTPSGSYLAGTGTSSPSGVWPDYYYTGYNIYPWNGGRCEHGACITNNVLRIFCARTINNAPVSRGQATSTSAQAPNDGADFLNGQQWGTFNTQNPACS